MPRPFRNENAARMNVLIQKNKTLEGLTAAEIAEFRKIEKDYGYNTQQLLTEDIEKGLVVARDYSKPLAERIMAIIPVLMALGKKQNAGVEVGRDEYIPADIRNWMTQHMERLEARVGNRGLTREVIEDLEREDMMAPLPAPAPPERLPVANNLELVEGGEGRFLRPSPENELRYRGVSLAIGRGRRQRRSRARTRRSRRRAASRRRAH